MPPTENLRRRVVQEDVFADGFVKTYHRFTLPLPLPLPLPHPYP